MPVIAKSSIPAAAKASAGRKLPADKGMLFGKNEGEFSWENPEHVMRMLLLFDAYHDFGDSARAKSAVPGDVYLRKPITNFPGCPGVWTVLEIMVGVGLTAVSDVEGELRKILRVNCPQLFTGVDVLTNTSNTYYDARTAIPPLDRLPAQFDIEKEHPDFKSLIERMVGEEYAKSPYYYADAGPGIGEKLQNGCNMRTTVLDSATASDKLSIDPPCNVSDPHVFGLFNLPMKSKTQIALTGTIRSDDFAYNIRTGGVDMTPPQNLAGKSSGPSLPFLSTFIRDDYLKQIILTGGPRNGLDRTHLAKNKIDIKDGEYKMFEVFKFLSDNGWSRTDLDSFAYNVKTSADYEQPREATLSGLIVGGTVDGEEALQIVLNKHISLYKHTILGKSSVTVFNVPMGNAANPTEVAVINAGRKYVSVAKEYNFYVSCCLEFETLRTSRDETRDAIRRRLGEFYEYVSAIPADPLILKLVQYVAKMFVDQMVYDIDRTVLPEVQFAGAKVSEEPPAGMDAVALAALADAMRGQIAAIDPEKFRMVAKTLQNSHKPPVDKLNDFLNQVLIEYGLIRTPDVPFEDIYGEIETLKGLKGTRVQTATRKSVHGVLNESVLKGLFSGVQTLVPWVMKDITGVKLQANKAADADISGNAGTAAYTSIVAGLQGLLAPAIAGGAEATGDYEAAFTKLYTELAVADDQLTAACNAIEKKPDDSSEVDEAYDLIMQEYTTAMAAVEDKVLEIDYLHYAIDLEEAKVQRDLDLNEKLAKFMVGIAKLSPVASAPSPAYSVAAAPSPVASAPSGIVTPPPEPETGIDEGEEEMMTRPPMQYYDYKPRKTGVKLIDANVGKTRRATRRQKIARSDLYKRLGVKRNDLGVVAGGAGASTHECPDCGGSRGVPQKRKTLKKRRRGGEHSVDVEIAAL